MAIDIELKGVGETQGMWTQLGPVFRARMGPNRDRKGMAVFQCACGRIDVQDFHNVKTGRSKRCRDCAGPNRSKHGGAKTLEYHSWIGMIHRCTNPKCDSYKDYGARGITVCRRWRDNFTNFFLDMGRRPSSSHSIERKDNNGNYEPGNCVWATKLEQARNKRNNVYLEINGERKLAKEWCEERGVKPITYQARVRRGMSPIEALNAIDMRDGHGHRVLSNDTVRLIRKMRSSGATYKQISVEAGASLATVAKLLTGKCYQDVQ